MLRNNPKNDSRKFSSLECRNSSCSKLKVALRIRPPNHRELSNNHKIVVQVLDRQSIIFDPPDIEIHHSIERVKRNNNHKNIAFNFDNVYGVNSTNEQIFHDLVQPNIVPLMDCRENFSMFFYGATGTGKTFTMFGKPRSPGIVYLSIREIFKFISNAPDDGINYDVYISYLEIYNDKIYDLLNFSNSLKLRENGKNDLFVSGLCHINIKTAQELTHVINEGNKRRTQFATESNSKSSRSHGMVHINIKMTNECNRVKFSKLCITDLAGSERVSSSSLTGIRHKEALYINKNLLGLGNCINLLSDGSSYIPYRDSKLTRLLKETLVGNCKSVMVANIAPTSVSYSDTYNTLKYSARASKIKKKLKESKLSTSMFDCIQRVKKINAALKLIENRVAQCHLCTGNKICPAAVILPLINAVMSQKAFVSLSSGRIIQRPYTK